MTENRELAETYLAMLNRHDPDMVDRFIATDYLNHNPFVGDGREANREFWADFFRAFPDLTATMDDLVIGEDRVVGRFTYRATHRGRFLVSLPPGNQSRCAPSTSGESRTASSRSTGMSSTYLSCSNNST